MKQGKNESAAQEASKDREKSASGGKTGQPTDQGRGDEDQASETDQGTRETPDQQQTREPGLARERREQGKQGEESRPDAEGDQSLDDQSPAQPDKPTSGAQGEKSGERESQDQKAIDAKAAGGDQPRDQPTSGDQDHAHKNADHRPNRDRSDAGTGGDYQTPDTSDADRNQQSEPPSDQSGRAVGRATAPPLDSALKDRQAEAVERFDQLGHQPGPDSRSETKEGQAPSLEGLTALGGASMAVMEQRLRQVEGDPSLLIRNQFRLEEMRQSQGVTGPWRERRPW
jgi:Ca-activated chloride channel family protein